MYLRAVSAPKPLLPCSPMTSITVARVIYLFISFLMTLHSLLDQDTDVFLHFIEMSKFVLCCDGHSTVHTKGMVKIKQEWKEVRVPGGNPNRCRENMLGPHRKAPAWNQTWDLIAVRWQTNSISHEWRQLLCQHFSPWQISQRSQYK